MKKSSLAIIALGGMAGALCSIEVGRRLSKRRGSKTLPENRDTENDQGTSMSSIEDGEPTILKEEDEHPLDDRGTDQIAASEILRQIRDEAFDASNEKLALALGRSVEEIEQDLQGQNLLDGDVLMKARALALQRGVATE